MGVIAATVGGVTPGDLKKPKANSSKPVSEKVASGLKKTCEAAGKIQGNSLELSRIIQIPLQILRTIELTFKNSAVFQGTITKLTNASGVLGTFSVLSSVKFFGARDFLSKDSSIYKVAAEVSLLFAGIGEIIVALSDCTLISLKQMGQAFSKIPGMSVVVKSGINFGDVVSGGFALGFTFYGAHSIHRALKETTVEGRRQEWLNAAWAATAVALSVFAIFGKSNVVGGIILGTVSALVGTAAFVHKQFFVPTNTGQNLNQ